MHAQRPAFAVCMQCTKALCQECATQWDGIWYCSACLALQRGQSATRSHALGWVTAIAGALLVLFAGTRLMVWTGVLLAGTR